MSRRTQIEASETCGCYHCLATLSANEIQTWLANGETAVFPRCGIDAVVGLRASAGDSTEHLKRMHDRSFGLPPKPESSS